MANKRTAPLIVSSYRSVDACNTRSIENVLLTLPLTHPMSSGYLTYQIIMNHCILYSIFPNKIPSVLVKYRIKEDSNIFSTSFVLVPLIITPAIVQGVLTMGEFFSVFQYFRQALQIKFYEVQSIFLKRVISLHEHLEVIYDDGT